MLGWVSFPSQELMKSLPLQGIIMLFQRYSSINSKLALFNGDLESTLSS